MNNLFDKVYNDTYDKILRYVIINCSNIEDVKDIIQNIYMDLYKKISSNIDINEIESYVVGIAKNKVKDYYRFKYKNKIISLFSKNEDINLIDNIKSDINIEEEIIIKEDIDKIWKFLKKKNVLISKIFYLYYYLGLSIKDISNQFNLSESNVKHYLYRTLKELNKYLKGDKYE